MITNRSKLNIITSFCLLFILCNNVSYAQRKASKILVSEARAFVLEKVGSSVKSDTKLLQSYENIYTYNKKETFLNDKFSCNHSRILRGTITTSFESINGNLVEGIRVQIDECDIANNDLLRRRHTFEGRYNSEYLFIYNTDVSYTNVYKFKIEKNGKLLKNIVFYQKKKGEIIKLTKPLNNEMLTDNITTYYTTYDVATTDNYLGEKKVSSINRKKSVNSQNISLSDKLKELKDFYKNGLITEEEYKKAKALLLEKY